MTEIKDLNYTVQVPYKEKPLECPFCQETIYPMVTVKVQDGNVRYSDSKGMTKNFGVDLEAEVQSVMIAHTCRRDGKRMRWEEEEEEDE
jgi:hypothetical protein